MISSEFTFLQQEQFPQVSSRGMTLQPPLFEIRRSGVWSEPESAGNRMCEDIGYVPTDRDGTAIYASLHWTLKQQPSFRFFEALSYIPSKPAPSLSR